MVKEQATYSHGHHPSVVTSHARRTAKDSAAFLLPHLRPTDSILDLGCGPGSITVDLAALVPEGRVLGLDAVASVLGQARALAAARGVGNVTFEAADANALDCRDGEFDVVFCHQLLQHVKDPVGILREMLRVAKPGGIVAFREADYSAFSWYPAHPGLDRWSALYLQQARANGGEPDAGRMLHAWARKAGFQPDRIEMSVASWCYTGKRAEEWGYMWAERTLQSGFAKTVKEKKLGTAEDLEAVSAAWKDWAAKEDVFFSVPNGEVLYRVP